jgi:hypothetical protein
LSVLSHEDNHQIAGRRQEVNIEKRLIWSVGKDFKDSGGSSLHDGGEPKNPKDADDYVVRID